ncbi:MAG: YbaB/EbfC family nucleoid-associated protein, partial [Spirochaetaceae bacterium]|nr:YbaB/EbfC family nucleoid-associated protein [Spirochaetaceae bacterium]
VDMDGNNNMLAVRIEQDAMDDREMLQALIMAAYNAAGEKVKEAVNDEIGSITGDISKLLPKDLSTFKF